MNQNIFCNWFHIWDAYSLGQNLKRFQKPASQLIKYAHMDLITRFCILVIPQAICQARAFKFGSAGALHTLININPKFYDNRKILMPVEFVGVRNTLINRSSRFCDNQKNIFLPIIWCIF